MVILSPSERRAIKPPDKLPVSEWAEQHIIMPGFSSNAGNLNMGLTPYFIEPLNCVSDPAVKSVAIMTGRQVGKTTVLLIIPLYFMHQDPSPTMMVMPKIPDAEALCELRFKAIIEESPKIKALMTGRAKDYKRSLIATDSMEVYFTGANSESGLISKSIRNLLMDEVDAYLPHLGSGASDPVSIATETTKTFFDSNIFMTSTPKTREGLIYREFMAGDQREYLVPCPECGEYQELIMAQLKWPSLEDGGWSTAEKRAAAIASGHLAHYECLHCQAELRERQKKAMVSAGVWCPKDCKVDSNGKVIDDPLLPHKSYHLGTLCSPFVSWSDNAAELIRAGTDANKLRAFRNLWEGLPWEERVKANSASHLVSLVKPYSEGEVDERVCLITAGIDVQGITKVLYYHIDGWAPGMTQSWRIRVGYVKQWDELEEIIFKTQYGGRGVDLAIIDSSYETKTVYAFARDNGIRCRPIKPRQRLAGGPVSAPTAIEMTISGKKAQRGRKLWNIDTNHFKDWLTDLIQVQTNDDDGYWIYNGIPEDYFKHMTAEHKIRDRDGKETWQPLYKGRRNDWFDCAIYSMSAAYMRGVHHMSVPKKDADRIPPGDSAQQDMMSDRGEEIRRPYIRRGGNGRKRAW